MYQLCGLTLLEEGVDISMEFCGGFWWVSSGLFCYPVGLMQDVKLAFISNLLLLLFIPIYTKV